MLVKIGSFAMVFKALAAFRVHIAEALKLTATLPVPSLTPRQPIRFDLQRQVPLPPHYITELRDRHTIGVLSLLCPPAALPVKALAMVIRAALIGKTLVLIVTELDKDGMLPIICRVTKFRESVITESSRKTHPCDPVNVNPLNKS